VPRGGGDPVAGCFAQRSSCRSRGLTEPARASIGAGCSKAHLHPNGSHGPARPWPAITDGREPYSQGFRARSESGPCYRPKRPAAKNRFASAAHSVPPPCCGVFIRCELSGRADQLRQGSVSLLNDRCEVEQGPPNAWQAPPQGQAARKTCTAS